MAKRKRKTTPKKARKYYGCFRVSFTVQAEYTCNPKDAADNLESHITEIMDYYGDASESQHMKLIDTLDFEARQWGYNERA